MGCGNTNFTFGLRWYIFNTLSLPPRQAFNCDALLAPLASVLNVQGSTVKLAAINMQR